MMEQDNRVFIRVHVEDPGYPLEETPPSGWPHIKSTLLSYSDLIVWRGKILKNVWDRYNRVEFLAELKEQGIQVCGS